MSAATVSTSFTAMGASSSAASVASAVYTSAVVGALVGAAASLLSGGDVMDGAMKGALVGGVTGGISKAMSGTESQSSMDAGLGQSGDVGTQAVDLETGQSSQIPTSVQAQSSPVQTTPSDQGLFSKATGWIQQNPKASEILSQTVGGAAKAVMDKKQREEELRYLMERDRLNRNVNKIHIKGTDTSTTALPGIGEFTERPNWEMTKDAGLFSKK